MKPLTKDEASLIKKLSDLIPLFDEIAKDTWPELFEKKEPIVCKNCQEPAIFFSPTPPVMTSGFLQYEDEYDV